MYSSQIVAERIKKAVKENNTTMDKLNSECSLSKNAISSASKSSEGMKAKNLYMIAEFLGVSVDYLLGRTDTPEISSGSTTSISDVPELTDKTTAEFLQIFQSLDISDRIAVMNLAIEKSKKQ